MLATHTAHAATRSVDLGTVEVQSPAPEAYREAMRVVLVRLTGRRGAATDRSLQPLIENAERYLQIYQPATQDAAARVTLDDLAVERALDALGEPVWPRERPVVLGVILAAPVGADPQRVREQLERAADERGLPLRLSPAAAVGLAGGTAVSAGEALAAARRAGAGATLVAQTEAGQWLWTLHQPGDPDAAVRFEGGVTAGVEGAADALALGMLALALQPVSEVELWVSGVPDLSTHGAVRRTLANLVVVKQWDLLEVTTDTLRLQLQVIGGSRALATALDAEPGWRRDGVTGGLRYRFTGPADTPKK